MRKIIITTCLIILASLGLAPIGQAITISPIIIENIELKPGEAQFRTFNVFNESEEEQIYYIFARNFVPVGEEGEIVVSEEMFGLATWISFTVDSISLAPGEGQEVRFSILAPENADAGGHYAAVFASTTPPNVAQGVGLSGNVGTLLLVTVEGDIKEDVRLLEFHTKGNKEVYDHLPVEFEYRIENRGSVHIKPQGTIDIRGLFGNTSIDGNPNQSRNLPNSIRRIESVWIKDSQAVEPGGFFVELNNEWKNFGLGKYTATLNLKYGRSKQTLTGETGFWVFPWRVCLVALSIFLGVLAIMISYNKLVIATARRKGKI